MKQKTQAYGLIIAVGDRVELTVKTEYETMEVMDIDIEVVKIDNDDRIHFEHGFGTIMHTKAIK